ncbi:MAG: 2'-5' RNA ligase family protein [Candidatus Pacebacteria bacterium]|nr:2'-5' RNA ligase family protein [Candidatus Paceibacterota bacterium]
MARVFIAINLPQEIKEKLVSYYNFELPAKWTKKENLHITVDFWGYIRDDKIPEIIEKTKEKAKNISPFLIKLNKICFAPPGYSIPKMVWVTGKADKLIKDVHITLARIKKWELQRQENIIEIEKNINLEFIAESLDVMESKLKKGEPEYILLQKNKFQ